MRTMFGALLSRIEARDSRVLGRLQKEKDEKDRAEAEKRRRLEEKKRRERKEIISALLSRGVPRDKFRFLGTDEDDPQGYFTNCFKILIGFGGVQVLTEFGDKWIVDEMNRWDKRYRRYIEPRSISFRELSIDERIDELFSIIESYPTSAEMSEEAIRKMKEDEKRWEKRSRRKRPQRWCF